MALHPRYVRYILRTALIGIASALVVVAAAGAVGYHYRTKIAQALLATVPKAPEPAVALLQPVPAPAVAETQTKEVVPVVVPATVETAVAKVNKSVVSIEVAQPVLTYTLNQDGSITQSSTPKTIGGGSGFYVSKNGLVLTNKHVVNFTNATFTVVTLSGKRYPATVVAMDPDQDIALLKISATTTPVQFGDSSTVQLGQSVVAIGFALGELTNSVSSGIISGLSRDITAGNETNGSTEQLDKLIQTDAAINPGNSGGPLLTLDGTVIGVNVATATGSQSIGFALPINSVKKFVSSNS